VPASPQSLSAVVVSGGKQYRVALGDRILVDRLAAEPGSELTLGRVLLLADGDDVKVGIPAVDGLTVTARVLGDRRGKKIDVLRYKSKKRVRVHRGARADLTALEILTIGGQGLPAKEEAAAKPAAKSRAKPRVEPKDAPEPAAAEAEAAAAAAEAPAEAEVEVPKPARRTRAKAAAKTDDPAGDEPDEEKTTDGT
jgi:large subunit ribosomal protein L21